MLATSNLYRGRALPLARGQRGASLLTALIILVAITILALGSLGTSLLELRMSSNHEATVAALQTAQAAVDAVIVDAENNFIVSGTVGDTRCANWPTSCVADLSTLPAPLSSANEVRVTRTTEQGCPPRTRNTASSCDHMNVASFELESKYDNTLVGGGKAALTQGYLKLIPVGGQSVTTPVTPAASN